MYDWEVREEFDGRIVAKLCGTQVHVHPNAEGAGWCWEVRFADGQTQSGLCDDARSATEKGQRVAERFLA